MRTVKPPVSLDAGTWRVDVSPAEPSAGTVARQVVKELRHARAVLVLAAGPAAEFLDQQAALGSRLPLALGLLGALTFLVLWLMTGSVVLPLKAIIMTV